MPSKRKAPEEPGGHSQQLRAEQDESQEEIDNAFRHLGLEDRALAHLQKNAKMEAGASVRIIVSILAIMQWMGEKLSSYAADTKIQPDMIKDLKLRIPEALHDQGSLGAPIKLRRSSTGSKKPSVLASWTACEKQWTERLAELKSGRCTEAQYKKQNREKPLPDNVTHMYKAICDVLVHVVYDPLTYLQNRNPTEMKKRVNGIRHLLGLEDLSDDSMKSDYRERILLKMETHIGTQRLWVWCYPNKINKDWIVVYYSEDDGEHINHIRTHEQWTWTTTDNSTPEEIKNNENKSLYFARLTPQAELKPVKKAYKPLMQQPIGRRHGQTLVESVMQLMLGLDSGVEVAVYKLVNEDHWQEGFFQKRKLEQLLDEFFSLPCEKKGMERFTERAKSKLMRLIWVLLNSQLLSLYEIMAHCSRQTIRDTDHAVLGAITCKGNDSEGTGHIFDDALMKFIHESCLLSQHPGFFTGSVFRRVKDDIDTLQARDGEGSSGN